jgi:amidase
LVPLSPCFDTATWLARDAAVFDAVGRVLLPPDEAGLRSGVQGLCVFDDASELADGEFSDPLARVTAALAKRLDLEPQHDRIATGASLADWRAAYTTLGAHDAWRVHGAWIEATKPHFGASIAERWQAASRVSEAEAAIARAAMHDIRARVRNMLGARAIAVLPSAASLAPLRAADTAHVQAVRMRTMAITCIAGLAGLPQVSLPLRTAAGEPVGVSLLGPAGSDRTLIELASQLHGDLD